MQTKVKIYVKNMVCDRCILVLSNLLNELQLRPEQVVLGQIDFGEQELDASQIRMIARKIAPLGFELIDNKKSRVIESIKNIIIEMVHHRDEFTTIKVSDFLRDRLYYDYGYLSKLFSSVEAVTIEQFVINQKIEKAKELLLYDELTLTEISYRLGYSSVAHLSRQFKKVTGLTPSYFKQLRDVKQRVPLDKV